MSARTIIEAETSEWIETWQELRPATAARIEAAAQGVWDTDVNMAWLKQNRPGWDKERMVSDNITIGNTAYEKRDGKWYRRVRRKNPAYWDQPQYFFMAPGPDKLAFIIVKMPRRLSSRIWRAACAAIYRDATGQSWQNVYGAKGHFQDRQQAVIDGAEEETYSSRVAGKKPEPAYEIFADGTWKKTSP